MGMLLLVTSGGRGGGEAGTIFLGNTNGIILLKLFKKQSF